MNDLVVYGFATKLAKKLTAKSRNQISEKNFALPGRRYPIHDRSHARSALAFVSRHGTDSEKSTVRAAVASKYPGMGQKKSAAVKEGMFAKKPLKLEKILADKIKPKVEWLGATKPKPNWEWLGKVKK